MSVVKQHEAFGDPDGPHELTRRNERRQREAEQLRNHVRRMHFHEIVAGESTGCFTSHTHDDDEIGHLHPPARRYPARADGGFIEELGPSVGRSGPPLRPEALEKIARLLSVKTPDDQLMRWRLRLFCGHVVERCAHITYTDVVAAFHSTASCPECGLDPATIVAGKPIGPKTVKEPSQPTPAEIGRRRDALAKQLRRAEAEAARLRGELETLTDESGGPK